jgi:hypothetical protein
MGSPSRTAFGLLKAPELQRLSVTVEVLRVMIVGVISVRVLSVGVMTLSLICEVVSQYLWNIAEYSHDLSLFSRSTGYM